MPVKVPTNFIPMIREAGHEIVLKQKMNVFMQGDPADSLYFVVFGRVRVYLVMESGEEMTLEILEQGRIFGDSSFLPGYERTVTIESIVETGIVVCKKDRLVHLCHQSEELMLLLFQHMTETCNYLTHQVMRATCYNSQQKVVDFLLYESDTRASMELPYSHEEIACSLSLNRVTVSRIISELKKNGYLESRYRRLIIKDPAGLRELLTKTKQP